MFIAKEILSGALTTRSQLCFSFPQSQSSPALWCSLFVLYPERWIVFRTALIRTAPPARGDNFLCSRSPVLCWTLSSSRASDPSRRNVTTIWLWPSLGSEKRAVFVSPAFSQTELVAVDSWTKQLCFMNEILCFSMLLALCKTSYKCLVLRDLQLGRFRTYSWFALVRILWMDFGEIVFFTGHVRLFKTHC